MEKEKAPSVKVPERLVSKPDGRKKAWWVKRIEELEAELAAYRNGNGAVTAIETPVTSVDEVASNASYADGFVDCMHRFQILNKLSRHRVHQQIISRGRGAVKNMHHAKFRGVQV